MQPSYKGFVGLKTKMYSFITQQNNEFTKSKAINKNFVSDKLKYEDYKNALVNKSYTRHEINRILGKDDNIGTYKINKISLSSYSDKKYILQDRYSRLSQFHNSTC